MARALKGAQASGALKALFISSTVNLSLLSTLSLRLFIFKMGRIRPNS
jgi:hypothetical protein